MKWLSVITSFVAAFAAVLLLKFLSYFNFVDWNPVGYTKKFDVFVENTWFVKWLVLFLLIWVIGIVLYFISIMFVKVPVSITSLILGLLIAVIAEWMIIDANSVVKTIKELSIPFICIVLILARFVVESAIFQYQDDPIGK